MPRDGKYVVAKEVRDAEKPHAVIVDARGQISFNPPTFAALLACNNLPPLWAAFGPINDQQWACDLVEKGTPGAVKVHRSTSENTARCSFGAVLAERPDLKVESGRQRVIPWTIDAKENRFILQLDQEENIPAPKRGSKKQEPSLTGTHPSKLAEM